MTWREASTNYPQGHRGVFTSRVKAGGQVVNRLPWWLGLLLGNVLKDVPALEVVILGRVVHWWTPVAIVVSSDAEVVKGTDGLLVGLARKGPVGERAGLDSAILEALASKGAG